MLGPRARHGSAALTALCAAVLALGWLGPAPALAQPVPAPAGQEIHTVRTAARSFAVHVNGVQRATVEVSDPAYTVRTALSADGRTAAVIPDFTGYAGSELRLLDVASGQTRTVARGEVTSAAFSAGGRLAYARLGGEVLTHSGTTG